MGWGEEIVCESVLGTGIQLHLGLRGVGGGWGCGVGGVGLCRSCGVGILVQGKDGMVER